MAINFVIKERSTEDIDNETKKNFELCKPYLEKGYGLFYAVREVFQVNPSPNASWFKNLKKHCWEQGYSTDKTSPFPIHRNGKYYYRQYGSKNRFVITRTINYERIYFGTVRGIAKAKLIVEELNKCDWDKSQFDRIKEKFGVKK